MQTAAELKQLLADAERAERAAEDEQRKVDNDAWKQITKQPDAWEWAVSPAKYNRYFDSKQEMNGLSVRCRVKPAVVQAWCEAHNGKEPPNAYSSYSVTEWHGMFYYRTDENILTHDGGGTCVLCDPKLCSDFEWAQLKSGFVLEKFKSRWSGGAQ